MSDRYPSATEYQEAIGDPDIAFQLDPLLAECLPEMDHRKIPRVLSGGFAYTFKLSIGSSRAYAVKCFKHSQAEQQKRYRAIHDALGLLDARYFVSFEYQQEGIQVNGSMFPILKMDWIDAPTIGDYIRSNIKNPDRILALREELVGLARFIQGANVAHGDIQNGNLLVIDSDGKLTVKLIDYDGMMVPAIRELGAAETGMPGFQHPRRTKAKFDEKLDRFSFLVYYTGLSLLAEAPELVENDRYPLQGETLLFKPEDFRSPGRSENMKTIFAGYSASNAVRRLAKICTDDYDTIPTIDEFLDRIGGPIRLGVSTRPVDDDLPPLPVEEEVRNPNIYIPSYAVVSPLRLDTWIKRIGDFVEVVGQVYKTHRGISVQQQPYYFINFSDFRRARAYIYGYVSQEVLKDLLPEQQDIAGKWVSIRGLLEEFNRGVVSSLLILKVQINVGSRNQISLLDIEEARRRLDKSTSLMSAVGNPQRWLDRERLSERRGVPQWADGNITSLNVNLACADGSTPLQIAIEDGNDEFVLWLLDRRADPMIACKDGMSTLDLAVQSELQNATLERILGLSPFKLRAGSRPSQVPKRSSKQEHAVDAACSVPSGKALSIEVAEAMEVPHDDRPQYSRETVRNFCDRWSSWFSKLEFWQALEGASVTHRLFGDGKITAAKRSNDVAGLEFEVQFVGKTAWFAPYNFQPDTFSGNISWATESLSHLINESDAIS